jgi:acyl-CoA reductase-like NAD-dependent aldehyde dehydrogenase
MAEMVEGKRAEFIEALIETTGQSNAAAEKSVDGAIDALVYYAGFADKYQQVVGCVNPVSGPHHNFTSPEAVGVVGLIASSKFDFAQFVAQLAAIIVTGNSLVALMSEEGSALLAPLAEAFATSDLPKGVVNLLSGHMSELYKHFGAHMEIQSLSVQCADKNILGEMREMAAANMKRVVPPVNESLSLEHLLNYVEYKTVWHPVGH